MAVTCTCEPHAIPPTAGYNPNCPRHGKTPAAIRAARAQSKGVNMAKQRKTRRPGRRGGGRSR